jgi:hypothetical protein
MGPWVLPDKQGEREVRHYQCDSPDAAGRIVAACLMAGGHVCATDFETLDRCGMYRQLSLDRSRLLSIVQGLYEDLTSFGYLSWSDVCQLDAETLRWLAADVRDERLRGAILELCAQVAARDGGLPAREHVFLPSLRSAWQ